MEEQEDLNPLGNILIDYPYPPLVKFLAEEFYLIKVINKDECNLYAALEENVINMSYISMETGALEFGKTVSDSKEMLDAYTRFIIRVFEFPPFEAEMLMFVKSLYKLASVGNELIPKIPADNDYANLLLFYISAHSLLIESYIERKIQLLGGKK